MYGVSRIDQPEKKNHGWYVRVTFKGKTEQKFFADKGHGGKQKALKAAQEHRDHLVTKLPPNRQEAAARKRATARKTARPASKAASKAASKPAPRKAARKAPKD
jgi:hypothetical protein